MLAYAIYYVTVVNVSDDYSFLTLGVITGATAVSVIGMHEWFRRQYGADRAVSYTHLTLPTTPYV